MIIRPTAFLLLLGLLAFGRPARGQVTAADARLTAAAVAAAQKQYTDSFRGHPQLYSGPEYVDYTLRYHVRIGHQFYALPEKQPGGVYYNDHYFPNLRLAYDVVLDQVVLAQPTSPLMLRLINEKVGYFFLNDHRFVRLVADSASAKVLRTGYYEVLVDGTVQVLAKRSKRLQEQLGQHFVDVEFTETDKFFIKKAGRYYPINTKSSVTRLFSDRSKDVQKYIQEHKLKFNKSQFESSVVQLAQYYGTPPQ